MGIVEQHDIPRFHRSHHLTSTCRSISGVPATPVPAIQGPGDALQPPASRSHPQPWSQPAERWTEQAGPRHEFLTPPHFLTRASEVAPVRFLVGEGVVAQDVPGRRDPFQQAGLSDALAQEEEGSPDPMSFQPVQHRGGVFGVRSIVEGEQDRLEVWAGAVRQREMGVGEWSNGDLLQPARTAGKGDAASRSICLGVRSHVAGSLRTNPASDSHPSRTRMPGERNSKVVRLASIPTTHIALR